MEIHVVINILLDYSNEFAQWKIARLLNRAAKCIVDTKKYTMPHRGHAIRSA